MGWETRGKHQYYYRTRREQGRVVKQYLGRGPAAEAAAAADQQRAAEKRETRQAIRDMERELAPLQKQMQQLDQAVRLLIEGVFLANGYHQVRSTWRHRND